MTQSARQFDAVDKLINTIDVGLRTLFNNPDVTERTNPADDINETDLTDQEKTWLQQAADDSVPVQRELWAASVKESLEEVQKAGVTIYRPDKAPYQDKVKDVYDSYKDQEVIYSYIKRIQELE